MISITVYHLQCARWDLSAAINDVHEFWQCGSEGADCELLHDTQRSISLALESLGYTGCRLPFPAYVDFRPEGWIEPLHPDAWHVERES